MKTQKMKMKAILAGGALISAIFAGAAENLVKNGDLQSVGEDGKLSEWKYGGGIISVQKDGDNKFARINNPKSGGYASISQSIAIKSEWEKLTLHFKSRVNSIDESTVTKPGHVPRGMFVFMTASGEKHYRPLCHLAEKTDGKFVEVWETVSIPPDSINVEVILDLPETVGEFEVDDIEVFADTKLAPLSVLKNLGTFDYRRKTAAATPPGWIVSYEISSQEKPQIRIESEGGKKFLRVENTDPNKDVTCENFFKLDPSWKKVKISAKIRTKDLKCGAEIYQDARVMVVFCDDKGNQVGKFGEVPFVKVDQDWKEITAVREVPEGATGIKLQVGLIRSTGTADFDDISVTKAE